MNSVVVNTHAEDMPNQAQSRTVIDEFNEFFHDSASARLKGNELLITIGNRTMHIQLPGMTGGESTGLSI